MPEISRTGGMRIVFEYSNRLTSRGHNVTLYSPITLYNVYKGQFKPYYIKYRLNYAGNLIKKKFRPPKNIYGRTFGIKYVPSINNFFIPDADAAIATSWPTAFKVHKLKSSKGRKFYLIQDYEVWYANKKYVDMSYSLPLNRIVVSTYLKDFLKTKFDVDSTPILIGLDYEKFNNPLKKFGYPKRILFMDHRLENKNTEGAIQTAIRLKEKYPDLLFRCFGIDRYHRMPEFVEFIMNPNDEKLVNIYRESDIFIFPSKYEGFGATPAEAMACKCAVVANAVAAIPEYSINNKTAILTNPDNPDELFNGVCYLLENPDELERISLAGHEYIKKILDWDRSVQRFEELLLNAD